MFLNFPHPCVCLVSLHMQKQFTYTFTALYTVCIHCFACLAVAVSKLARTQFSFYLAEALGTSFVDSRTFCTGPDRCKSDTSTNLSDWAHFVLSLGACVAVLGLALALICTTLEGLLWVAVLGRAFLYSTTFVVPLIVVVTWLSSAIAAPLW